MYVEPAPTNANNAVGGAIEQKAVGQSSLILHQGTKGIGCHPKTLLVLITPGRKGRGIQGALDP